MTKRGFKMTTEMTTENGYWTKIISNYKEDRSTFEDLNVLRRMNSGMDYQKARLLFKIDQKRNPRRFSPDMKPHRIDKNFPFKENRLSPEMIAYLAEKPKFIPKQEGTATYKGKGRVPEHLKKKREGIKKQLLAAGMNEEDAAAMAKTIK